MKYALLLPFVLLACGEKDGSDTGAADDTAAAETQAVSLTFDARLGGEGAACGVTAAGVGSTSSEVELVDLRFYVHDVRLLDSAGGEHAVTLTDDGVWQSGGVALLDFEDASGRCSNGTSPVNAQVVGEVAPGEYTGVRFTLGVPFELNHADPAAAASPLNLTTLHWSWEGGYKFLRMDLSSAGMPEGWLMHLGSTGCEADADGVVTGCASPNLVEVELSMDVDSQVAIFDGDALLAGVNVDADEGGAPGCMSGGTDPECAPILSALGLNGGQQSLFSVE